MKKALVLLSVLFSLSAMAEDITYQCTFNAKVETVRTNIFGGSPKTIKVEDLNPCSLPSITSIVSDSGSVNVSECGVFRDGINFGLSLRSQKVNPKQARFELIHLNRKMKHINDYEKKNVLIERYVDLGKEVVFEVDSKIDLFQVSRRVKEVATNITVVCIKAN